MKSSVFKRSVLCSESIILSLFAGCGGLDYGFHNNPKYKHVLVNDFDKDDQ